MSNPTPIKPHESSAKKDAAAPPATRNVSRSAGIVCALVFLTLVAYWPVLHCGFLGYDDDGYVTNNPRVLSGLTWSNVRWALTATYEYNWHPLTWISHMTDVMLFGLNPAGHHAVNLLFHVLNTVLVFLMLRRMTGAEGRSAFVAALFALHPLHVESVAWIAERKDVLSTFFWALTLLAYTRYVELCPRSNVDRGSRVESGGSALASVECSARPWTLHLRPSTDFQLWARYALVLVFFALSLLSKPMVVTLPFLLLLVDVWPLQRMPMYDLRFTTWKRPVLEKLPLLAMAIVTSVLTVSSQEVAQGLKIPLAYRLSNATVSYLRYILKTVWPTRLVVPYPLELDVFGWKALASLGVLAFITWLVLQRARRFPFLFTGWFWFLGTLVPVIGILQVGSQAMADRYMYVPALGLFIIIAWCGYDLARRAQIRTPAVVTLSVLTLFACLGVVRLQLRYWKDTIALFEHTVHWTSENFTAEWLLGKALLRAGQLDAAGQHLRTAIRIDPVLSGPHRDLGNVLARQGKPAEAGEEFSLAVRYAPDEVRVHDAPDETLLRGGNPGEALQHLTEAARLNPDDVGVRVALAAALNQASRVQDAITQYREALARDPNRIEALNNLAWILAANPDPKIREGEEAVRLAEKACDLTQYHAPRLMGTLAVAYAEAGRFADGAAMARRAQQTAVEDGKTNIAEANRKLAEQFDARRPYHDGQSP